MNTDCAFYIGSTHDVCQDYAMSGKSLVTISDGCSGSAFSDIGSRIISITAMNQILELDSLYSFDPKECILLSRPIIKMLNMPEQSLDATLFSSILHKESLQTMGYGDGVIAIKMKNGEMIVINSSYDDSYPFFMNYLYGDKGRYREWLLYHNRHNIHVSTITADGEVKPYGEVISKIRLKDIGTIGNDNNRILIEIIALESIEFVAIMSDGIHSFYERINTESTKWNAPIQYHDVLKELLSFKNFNGKFVQRRMNKFRKNCLNKNWEHYDDISLAVIHVEK